MTLVLRTVFGPFTRRGFVRHCATYCTMVNSALGKLRDQAERDPFVWKPAHPEPTTKASVPQTADEWFGKSRHMLMKLLKPMSCAELQEVAVVVSAKKVLRNSLITSDKATLREALKTQDRATKHM